MNLKGKIIVEIELHDSEKYRMLGYSQKYANYVYQVIFPNGSTQIARSLNEAEHICMTYRNKPLVEQYPNVREVIASQGIRIERRELSSTYEWSDLSNYSVTDLTNLLLILKLGKSNISFLFSVYYLITKKPKHHA